MGRHSCCYKQNLKKGLWSPEEDEKLLNYITRYGVGSWSSVPKRAGLQRCGKSCRLRWINYLRPDLKRGSFTRQEEDLIIALHQLLGNRWSRIASQLPGRTDNEVKNFWNSRLRKRLRQLGIDPRTHRPLSQAERPDDEKAAVCDPFPSLGPPTHLPWTAPVNLHQFYQLRQNLVASDPTHLPAASDFEPATVVASGDDWFDSAVMTGAWDGHGNGESSSSGRNGGGDVGFPTHVVMEKHGSFEYWETGRDPLMESLLARPWNETAGCTRDLSEEVCFDDLCRVEL